MTDTRASAHPVPMISTRNKESDIGEDNESILWILWIVRARSANRSAPQEAPALLIICDILRLIVFRLSQQPELLQLISSID